MQNTYSNLRFSTIYFYVFIHSYFFNAICIFSRYFISQYIRLTHRTKRNCSLIIDKKSFKWWRPKELFKNIKQYSYFLFRFKFETGKGNDVNFNQKILYTLTLLFHFTWAFISQTFWHWKIITIILASWQIGSNLTFNENDNIVSFIFGSTS